MMFLKQSTAVDVGIGPFLDETDGFTAMSGLTLSQADIRLKKNAGAWAQKNDTNAATHEEAGWYECALNTTDTDTLGKLLLAVHESGALPVWHEFTVLAANVYDSLIGGTDALQVHANEITNGLITAAAIATGAVDADALATDAVNEIADGIMTRASTNWEASAPVKSLGTAVMLATHHTEDDAGTLRVYRADGTTPHASAAITTNAAKQPIEDIAGLA